MPPDLSPLALDSARGPLSLASIRDGAGPKPEAARLARAVLAGDIGGIRAALAEGGDMDERFFIISGKEMQESQGRRPFCFVRVGSSLCLPALADDDATLAYCWECSEAVEAEDFSELGAWLLACNATRCLRFVRSKGNCREELASGAWAVRNSRRYGLPRVSRHMRPTGKRLQKVIRREARAALREAAARNQRDWLAGALQAPEGPPEELFISRTSC